MRNEIIPNLEVSPKVCFASPSKFILYSYNSLIHILKINVIYISFGESFRYRDINILFKPIIKNNHEYNVVFIILTITFCIKSGVG